MSWTHLQAKALTEVFEALNSAEIPWLVLRNHEGLPARNRSKDVDLGLKKSDFGHAHLLIADALRRTGFDRELVEDFQYVRCLTYFGEFGDRAHSLKIDLLDGFVFRGAQIFNFEELIKSAPAENGIKIPHQTDDGVMLWMKPLLTGGIVKPKYIKDILASAQADPDAFRDRLNQSFSIAVSKEVWGKIERGDLLATVPMKRKLRRAAWWTALRQRPGATLRNAIHHYYAEIRRRSWRNPATFISVAGPDGAGKTTFIDYFAAQLADLQVKDLDSIRIEHFRPHVFPNIKKLLTGQDEQIEAFHDPHRAAPAGRLSSILRLIYYWLDYVVGYWARIRQRCITGQTVIFDRYFYDFIVDPRRSRLSLPSGLTRAFLLLTPKPDIVFILTAAPETIYARKQELPLAEIDRQIEAYRALAQNDPGRFVLLNATQAPEKIARDAISALIARSYQKTDINE